MRRLHPKVVTRIWSPNRYSPRGQKPSLIVIHDTESQEKFKSAADLEAIGNLFAKASFQASAHVCTDGDGHSARYVADKDAAWQCRAYNRAALGIEQIGYAAYKAWRDDQVNETARWVAHWSIKHKIPIRRAWVLNGRVIRSGVITHAQLGAAGGGHSDPGPNYPMGVMKKRARKIKRLLKKRR